MTGPDQHPTSSASVDAASAGDDVIARKIVAALDRIARGITSHRRAVATAEGLTALQLELLRSIAEAPPPRPGAGELAIELGISQPTVTDSLAALERKGHVARYRDPADGRRSEFSLTDSGKRVVDHAQRGEQVLRAMVADLDEADREQLLGLLLRSITGLLDHGVIQVARTCTTCRFFQHSSTTARCTLLDMTLEPADLRVNCAEHQPAGRP